MRVAMLAMFGVVAANFCGCTQEPRRNPTPAAAPRTAPASRGYTGARSSDWEAGNPHCVGHSHLSHCFFRISMQPFRLEPTPAPDYARWPSNLGAGAWCMDGDGATNPSCRELAAPESPWLPVQGSSVQLRYTSKEPDARWGGEGSSIRQLQARQTASGPVQTQPLYYVDEMSLWTLPEGDTILVERSSFLGE